MLTNRLVPMFSVFSSHIDFGKMSAGNSFYFISFEFEFHIFEIDDSITIEKYHHFGEKNKKMHFHPHK